MTRLAYSLCLLLGLVLLAGWCEPPAIAQARQKPAARPLSYERDILPLFQTRCLGCHGKGQPRAGIDLRTLGKVMQGGSSGPAIVAGEPEKSLLYSLLKSGKMPPAGAKLTPRELKQVETWIKSGAGGTTARLTHWAFRPPQRPAVPTLLSDAGLKPRSGNSEARLRGLQSQNQKPKTRNQHPIDVFLLAQLERKGLTFAPEAEKRTLLRRVTYDLIGLPPTPEEIAAFLQDRSPKAYEKVVDRLLADARFGEHQARHWLDTAGYADSEGVLQEDRIRPNAWRYRDYVIRSFNADKPYDRFLREQIAGDELVDYRNAPKWNPEIEEAITATGFLRTAVDATRDDFNTHQFTEYQYRMLNDTQTILVSTTLGLTLHCARCHNHKYEPLSQKDYYRVQSLLEGAVRPKGKLLPTNRRQIVAGTLAEQKQAAEVNQKVEAAVQALQKQQAQLLREYRLQHIRDKVSEVVEADRMPLVQAFETEEAKRNDAQKALLAKYKTRIEIGPEALVNANAEYKQKRQALLDAEASENKKRIVLPEIRALYDQDAAPPPTALLIRGEIYRPGESIEPGIPTILDDAKQPFRVAAPSKDSVTTGRRRAFAEWLTRRENPLTARVMVNRLWTRHFGVGLVPSADNFGVSGAEPTHPALLDWLSCEFMKGIGGSAPWSLKALHRLMVTSAAYRQSSRLRPEAAKTDPENRLLWRQRPRRLEAEAIRDGIFAVSGRLDSTLYGEPVQQDTRETGEIVPVGEEKPGRRSIYLLVRRSMPVTFLQVFDAPVMETNCTRRVVSTTATQALTLLNSSFMATEARHFAQRLLKESPPEKPLPDSALLSTAYQRAFARPPSPAEQAATLTFLRDQTALYTRSGKSPADARVLAFTDFCHTLLSANEFVYVD